MSMESSAARTDVADVAAVAEAACPAEIDAISPAVAGHPMVEVRHSPVHGFGVFATKHIPAGSFLAFYEGRRYTARQMSRIDFDDRVTYLFGLSDGSTIDGAEGGNFTRHLNHACAPNCEGVEEPEPARRKGGRKRLTVRIVTTRDVLAGEELFLDYALTIDDAVDRSAYRCYCGAAECRGDMVGA